MRTWRCAVCILAAAAVVAAALALGACSPQTTQNPVSSSAPSTPAVPPERRGPGSNQAAGDASNVSPLAPAGRAKLPQGFPIEVPVPSGSITRAEAQGDSAWVYELSVEAQPFDVAAWYRAAYASANWQILRDQVAESGGMLIFAKGMGAQSKIRLTAEPGGTKVTASVGVGEAVGDTL